MFIQMTAEW